MDRGDTLQVSGNLGKNVDFYFHPLSGLLSPVWTWRVIGVEEKSSSSTGNGKAIRGIRAQKSGNPVNTM